MSKASDACSAVGVMARFPVAGSTKTRLAATIGHERATLFYRLCAQFVFKSISTLPERIHKYVFVSEGPDSLEVARWTGQDFKIRAQEGNDLGQRLTKAFADMFAEGAHRAIMLASDVPDISADMVLRAMESLNSSSLTIGPCHDGGYYLIGMTEPHPELFSTVEWSTSVVLEETLRKARTLDLNCTLFPVLSDIDTVHDLHGWLATPSANFELRDLVRTQILP